MARLNDQQIESGHGIGRELGDRGLKDIAELRRRVFNEEAPPQGGWHGRLAPSIIARSEAELFGLSVPRFALRIYLDETRTVFVNARRIRTLSRLAKWGGRASSATQGAKGVKSAKEVLRNCICIADCLLPAAKFDKDYHVIKADLGTVYGEVYGGQADQDIWGVPYVMHMRLAGGLCAQAVCFMATVLLHRHVEKGVFGVAEITALSKPSTSDELLLSGLNLLEMADYFRVVGLNGIWQHIPSTSQTARVTKEVEECFDKVVRAYLRSGMPVVLPVDVGRMAGICPPTKPKCQLKPGKDLFDTNKVPNSKKPKMSPGEIVPQRHVVLLVGYHKGKKRFLYNDPALYPFMKGTVAQLLDVRQYTKGITCDDLTDVRFLPVTPGDVQLPLQNALPTQDSPFYRLGLLSIAKTVQSGQTGHDIPGLNAAALPGRLLLTTRRRLREDLHLPQDEDPYLPQHVREAAEDILNEAGVANPDHWFWTQYVERFAASPQSPESPESLWLWDAQMGPVRMDASQVDPKVGVRYLIGFRVWGKREWTGVFPHPDSGPKPGSTDLPPAAKPDQRRLRPSVISSFSVQNGLEGAGMFWPDDRLACEAYMLMQVDCERLLRFPNRTAIDSLADLYLDPSRLRKLAEKLEQALGCELYPHKKCCGFATFLPEIAAGGEAARKAQNALRGLIQLAGALRRQGHPDLSTIEIVAGSLIRGVCPVPQAKGKTPRTAYVASRDVDDDRTLDTLCASLEAVADEATGLRLAVELEPGPLYMLRDIETLKEFCKRLKAPALCGVVGLNLDCAHWAMAGISPAQVRANLDIFNRIVHCHISDHADGHFGDLVIGDYHANPRDFYEWVRLARELMERPRPDGYPSFSGFASVELEAVKDDRMVALSARRLQYLIDLVYCGYPPPKEWPDYLR